jgi:F0F1-type ATP synthase membrane subunit c/vacuolar-type H+-ATPase subunit K
MNRPAADAGPNVRLRTMRILWAVFLACIVQFFLVGWFTRPEADVPTTGGSNPMPLLYGAAVLGLVAVSASFAVKGTFYRRAAERQEPARMQTGFILALLLCEVAAMLGLVALFVTLSGYSHLLLALGALGQLLHFPRREEVLSAYYKPTA